MSQVSSNGYTVLVIHTWVLWVAPIGIAIVSGWVGRVTGKGSR
jgi:cytochrome c-type biogenesis protein CcmH/NrfF